MSLIGKVILINGESFLVLGESGGVYSGYWAEHPRNTQIVEVTKFGTDDPTTIANNLEELIAMRAVRKSDVEARRMYLNKVCLSKNSVLGIVTSYEDGMCHGLTPSGDEWHCQDPEIVACSLCDYINKGIEKKVRAAL